MKSSLIIVTFFVIGIVAGLEGILPEFLIKSEIVVYPLYLLMFLVAVGIGADKKALKIFKATSYKILLIPIFIVVGTLSGVAIISLFLSGISIQDSLAVGAGMGYYSLSSVLIGQIKGETLGVIALMSNIMREIFTLLVAPLLVKYFGKIAPISTAGATSMDTTLPIIIRFSGKDYAVISIVSGTILTILVPFLVVFILQW
ncbi:MAG: lysine exporter LysO family protein [Bacteroidota bacterium]|nr:lysine exporter LysO family protein [Bacteroidota bacterium]